MAGDLATIRQGLADALSARFDGRMQVSAYMLSDPTPPSAQIVPDETDYHEAMADGCETWGLICQVVVALNSDRGAQELLDQMLSPTGPASVKEALEAAPDPGGPLYGSVATNGVVVERTSGYRTYRLGSTQAEALGAEWHLKVTV